MGEKLNLIDYQNRTNTRNKVEQSLFEKWDTLEIKGVDIKQLSSQNRFIFIFLFI